MSSKLSLIVALAALAASGCGGGDTNTASSTSASTATATTNTSANSATADEGSAKRQLIATADPICEAMNARTAAASAVFNGAGNLTDPQTVKKVAHTGLALANEQHGVVAQLSALKAPPSLAQHWKILLEALQVVANYTAQLGLEAKTKNIAIGEETIRKTHETRRLLKSIAQQDGFRHCGRTD
jgi:hypothetical protein